MTASKNSKQKAELESQKDIKAALLVIDMINEFDFVDGAELFEQAVPAAKAIASLRERLGVPTIFVNDNFHHWHVSFENMLGRMRDGSGKGNKIMSLISPGDSDYFILKPHQSGFFQTALEALLRDLNITDLIVTGVATDMCILATTIDAYLRGFKVFVPKDCSAAVKQAYHKQALNLLKRNYCADITRSDRIMLDKE